MSQGSGVVTVYNVSLTPENKVRLEMIITAGSFPDFHCDFDVATAERIGRVMMAMADYSYHRKPGVPPTHVSQSVDYG